MVALGELAVQTNDLRSVSTIILRRSAVDIQVIHTYHWNISSFNNPTVDLHRNNLDIIYVYCIHLFHLIEHSFLIIQEAYLNMYFRYLVNLMQTMYFSIQVYLNVFIKIQHILHTWIFLREQIVRQVWSNAHINQCMVKRINLYWLIDWMNVPLPHKSSLVRDIMLIELLSV